MRQFARLEIDEHEAFEYRVIDLDAAVPAAKISYSLSKKFGEVLAERHQYLLIPHSVSAEL